MLGNANLQGQAAGLILNEVTGGNPSQLEGYTEVAGKSAHVIVANPHGITCDGCGFLNTPRVTLSTGKPVVENGRLDRFSVDGGEIAIEGTGLNASNIDQFDLITRSAKLNAELHAKQLNVITGRNEVKAGDLSVTAKADDGSAKPALAIDSSALGGMYAGAIRLVGTEAGVGVKLAGDMAASGGDIRIDANGRLTLAQTAASGDIALKAQDIELTGKTYAGNRVDAQASGEIANRQSLAARNTVSLTGAQVTNGGVIEAGVNPDNTRNTVGDVSLTGQDVRNSGTVIASRNLDATLTGTLDNRGGTLSGKTGTAVSAATLDNSAKGRLLSSGSLTVEVDALNNRGGLIASGKDLNLTSTNHLDNQAGEISSQTTVAIEGGKVDNRGGLITAGSTLGVTASELDNSAQGTLSSQGSLKLAEAAVNNQDGAIVAAQRLDIAGKTLDNRGGLVSGKADVAVAVDALLDNREQGTVIADGQLSVTADELRNGNGGQVAAKGDTTVRVGNLSQQGGELLSQGQLTLDADRVDNRHAGLIAASKGLEIRVGESLLNGGGEISTQGKASLRVQAAAGQPAALLDNSNGGLIIGDQGLTLTVQRLLNHTKGVLSGRDGLLLTGDSLDNSAGGTLSSQKTLGVKMSGALDNHGQGALLSGGNLTVDAGSLDNSAGGLLSSAGALGVSNGSLNNQGGKLVSDGQLSIANNRLDNSNGGVISAGQALSIGTGQLDNQQQGLIRSGAGLTITAGQINNHDQGQIAAKGAMQVTASGLDQQKGGELVSETALTLDLQGGALNNSNHGLIATPGALLLNNLGRVDNSVGGEISSTQSFLLKASELNNAAGRVISGQDLQLQITGTLLNNLKGALSAAKLTVQARSLDNSAGGVLVSQGDIGIDLKGKLDNHDQGLISAGTALTLDSGELDNSNDGLLASGTALRLTTGSADNQGGILASQGTLEATAGNLDNRNGVISSQRALSLTADAVDNRDKGLIASAAGLTLTADSLDSSNGGEVSAKDDLRLTVARLIQQQGRLIGEAGVHLDLLGGDLDNRGGLLSAQGPLTLENLATLDNRGGELSSSQSYNLTASAIDNGDKGRLISAGTLGLELGTGELRNANGGLISGWQGLTVEAGSLDNSGLGTVSSREGSVGVALSGALDNSGEGALVSKGVLTVAAASLDNSAKGILSSGDDLELTLSGALNNRDGGLIDTQGGLTASAGAVDNHAGQIGSQKTATVTASSLDNSAGQLSGNAALTLTLTGNLLNTQSAKLASAGPLVLKAAAIDNRGGSLISQNLLQLTAASLNNSNSGTLAARNALGITLNGALDNSADGLIHSQQSSIGIRAQSLNNADGTLSSQQDLAINLDGTLNNQGGRLESRAGNLDLQKASSVDNSGGVLSSMNGWLKLITTGLFDNDAGTTQAQALDITANGLDNRGGHLSALTGDADLDLGTAAFNNQDGGLYAHRLLAVVAGDFNNQGVVQGEGGQVGAQRIDFGLSGALRNGYGIVESGSTLSLDAVSIDNQYGNLRALGVSGDTRIASGTLDNRNGTLETANTNLAMSVAGLQSTGGRILHSGNGIFGLSAAQVMGAGGDLSTNGLLTLTADNWTNSGVLQAGQLVLNIGTFTQTASGQLLAGRSLTGTGTQWINHGLLASDGTVNLTLTGSYGGNGQLTSLGDLSLSAASIDLASSARIAGGGTTTVSSTGLLTNRGKLTSAGDLALTSNTLNNYGTLGSAGKLRIEASGLLNESGLIFSGGDMTLRVNDFTNLRADVYSLGSLWVSKDDGNNWSASLENISGTIESHGDMQLRTTVLNNRKENFELSDRLVSGEITYECKEHDGHCAGSHYDIMYYVDEVIERVVQSDSAAANIISGGNLSVLGDTFANSHSLVSAVEDISIDVKDFSNEGAAASTVIRHRMFRTPVDSESGARFWEMVEPGGAISEYAKYNSRYVMKYWNVEEDPDGGATWNTTNFRNEQRTNQLNAYYDPDRQQPVPSRILGYTLFSSSETVTPSGTASNAVVQAGGSVQIKATSSFNNSVLTENTNVTSGTSRVGSTATSGTGKSFVVKLNAQLPPELQQQQINPLTLPGFTLPQGENGLFRLSGQGAANGAASAVQGATDGSVLTGSTVAVGDGQQSVGPVDASGVAWSVQNGQSTGGTPTDATALMPGGVQSLPNSTGPSVSHKYLIETNPALTNLKQFMSSDYLLGNLGYDTDTTQKRLGDGLYEQRLIREAIVARTGQRFLAGLTSDEAMFRYLMDNAIASKESLNLSLGVTLTAEQVAALTHDIVWLEEYEVNGEKVLVPVLYLAQAEGRLAPSGALIQGRDVALISGGELNNQGTLRASGNLDITAGNISNTGLMQANERLSLLATESIRNAQGGIITGRDVDLTALNGDVLNERTVTRNDYRIGNRRYIQDYVDSASRIEAASALEISAGRDIANLGSVLESRGDLALSAGRDVSIASVEQLRLQTKGSRYRDEHVAQIGAQVVSGGDIAISADRDLQIVTSRLEAQRDLALVAGGDVLVSAAANEDHFYSKSKKVTQSTDSVRQQSSVIQAGRDVTVEAGEDLTLVASRIKGGNDVDLDAGQDINVLSAKDESASFYFKKSKGSFGRSKSKQKESYDSTNVASVIEAGNDLTLNTSKAEDGSLNIDGGRNVTVIGSQLDAGNDLLVGATGDVAILSGVEEHGSYSKKTKSGFLGLSKSGKSQLKTHASQVASELEADNDVVIAAGNDIRLRASETSAGNDVELHAGLVSETGDINLVSANDTAYSLTKEYKKKVGLSLSDSVGIAMGTPSWGGDISLASAKKAGKEAISSTNVGSQVTAERDATLQAERDINIVGSGVSAGRNVLLDAGRDVNVVAGTSSQQTTTWENTKTFGMQQDFDRNGYTTFIGEEKLKDKKLDTRQTAAASQIDAGLDLDVKAGRDIVQQGSDMSAGYDINLQAGRNILIDAAPEQSVTAREQSQTRTGTTTKVSHNVGNMLDALNGAGKGDNAVSQVSSVLQAADAVTQVLSGPSFAAHVGTGSQSQSSSETVIGSRPSTLQAGNDINATAGNDFVAKGSQFSAGRDINVTGRDVSFDVARGSQSSQSEQSQGQSGINSGTTFNSARAGVGGSHGIASAEQSLGTAAPTQLLAGRDINLQASHDLSLIGTQAQAARDINLKAANDLNIRAAQNDSQSDSSRRSGGGEVGVVVGGNDFIALYASVDFGKGNLDRVGARQQEAYLYAGRGLNFESGRDTTVAGARLEGEEVTGKVGRDLTVSSVPNTGKVSGKELDASMTVTIGYGSGSVSGSLGVGKTTGKTDWVENQTSIVARDRLDIRTEDHTQIDGAVIASRTGNLKLDTGTLGFRDIEGEDKEHSYYINAGGSYGWGGANSNAQKDNQPATGASVAVQDKSQEGKGEEGANGWSLSGYDYRKEREQIVRATVGEGEIVVRSDAETGKDSTAGLNRDPSKAYEITKDDEERTDLYVSKSSVEAVRNPVGTYSQWKSQLSNYAKNSDKAGEKAKKLIDKSGAAVQAIWNEIQAQNVSLDSVPNNARDALGDEKALAMAKNLVRNGKNPSELAQLDEKDMAAVAKMAEVFEAFDYAVATCQASGRCPVVGPNEKITSNERVYQYTDAQGETHVVRLIGLDARTSGEKMLATTDKFMGYLDTLPKEQAQVVLLGVQAFLGPTKAAVGLAGNFLISQLFGEEIEAYKNSAALSIADTLTRKEREQLSNSDEALKALNAEGKVNETGDAYVRGASGLLDIALGTVGGIAGKVASKAIGVNTGPKATGKDYVDILSPEAKKHILYGDKPGSGGHMWPGQPGKTVFPQSWSADKIVHEVGDIATSPNTKWYAQTGTGGIYTSKGDPAKWVAYEVRDGVRMRVVYQPATGTVVTAFPDNAPIPPYKPIK
nr:hemagglutinin repeat-containing protein [Pseudomonas sp. PIC25]